MTSEQLAKEAAGRLLARQIIPTGTNLNLDIDIVARYVLASRVEDRRDLAALLQEYLDQCDNQDCSLCERGRAALSETADRGLAVESVLASSRLVDHEGQCVTCWTYVGDPDPEPHAPGCLIERLRAALSATDRTVRDA